MMEMPAEHGGTGSAFLEEPALTYAISIAGTTIDGVGEWNERQSYKLNSVQVPSAHGGVGLSARRGQNTINLSGRVFKSSGKELRDYIDAIESIFTRQLPGKIIRLSDGRYKYVQALSFNKRHEWTASPIRIAAFQYVLEVLDPFWYAAEDQEIDTPAGSSPWTFAVTNYGTQDTPPVFEITAKDGARSNMRMIDTTTGETWIYTGTIKQDKKLVVDARQCLVHANNVKRDTTNFEGFLFPFVPGNNVLRYQGDVPVDIKVKWNERF